MSIEYLRDDPGTIRQVAGWLYSEWGHLSRGGTLERAVRRMAGRAGRREIPLAFLARKNGVPVGTASLTASDMTTRLDLTPWLASVYVLPDYRGRGLGAALCRRVLQEADRLGTRRIYLFTHDKADFYRHMGWKEIRQAEYRSRRVVTIMSHG